VIPFFMRRATSADSDRVQALLNANDLPTDGVAEAINDFIVAEVGDNLIGAIGIELYGRTGLLRSAVVSPERRGQGIGRALVGELLSKSRSMSLESLYLLTTTAEPYFESFGFATVDRSTVPAELNASAELRGACPDTATVMRLLL
jgi:N-acetylglutamate synthase-like GNAT family acetyltransferase